MEELTNLKKIAEKQLEEALESLQAEREQRFLKSLKMFKFLCCSRCSSFYVVLVVQEVQVVEFGDCVFICILYSRYALKKELDKWEKKYNWHMNFNDKKADLKQKKVIFSFVLIMNFYSLY